MAQPQPVQGGDSGSLIKGALHQEVELILSKLRESLEERFQKQEKAFTELQVKFDDAVRNMRELDETQKRQKTETDGVAKKAEVELESFKKEVKLQFDRLESDTTGPGGLHQLRGKLAGVDTTIIEHAQLSRQLRGAVDGFDMIVTKVNKQCDDLTATFERNSATLQGLEGTTAALAERQQGLETGLEEKHDKMWKEVTSAVDALRGDHKSTVNDDIEVRKREMKQYAQSHVKYVTTILATTHAERKNLAACKGLLQVWREHVWTEARKKTGLRWLANAVAGVGQRRERVALERWQRQTSIESLSKRLSEEYTAKLPNVLQILEQTGLQASCNKLTGELQEVKKSVKALDVKTSDQTLSNTLGQHAKTHEEISGSIQSVNSKVEAWMKEHKALLASTHEKLDTHRAATDGHKERLETHHQRLEGIMEQFKGHASNDEVRTIMRDVLLMWSSIKQLDTAKADKTTVDAFASEIAATHEEATKKQEELQLMLGGKVSEETLKVKGELESKVVHWEQMWGKVAGLVEDLLTKVEDLQNAKPAQKGKAAPNSEGDVAPNASQSTLRPSSMPPPAAGSRRREHSASNLRSPAPRACAAGSPAAAAAALHSSGGGAFERECSDTPTNRMRRAPSGGPSVTTVDIGKGLIDAVFSSGGAPPPMPAARPARPSRPSSANSRRPGTAGR